MSFDNRQPINPAPASPFLAVDARAVALAFSPLVSCSKNGVNNGVYTVGFKDYLVRNMYMFSKHVLLFICRDDGFRFPWDPLL